jgi:hypothetical protein
MLLQVNPEKFRIAEEIPGADPHRFQFRIGEMLLVLPSPLHPVHGYAGPGILTIIDLFHGTRMEDVNT